MSGEFDGRDVAMAGFDFWKKQESKPLFPDIEWNKPEQKTHAGKMAIIGGNKLGFAVVAMNTTRAAEFGVGEVKALLPDSLKKNLPVNAATSFAPSNLSGGFSKEAIDSLQAMYAWADVSVLIGDLGKNSETAIALEDSLFKNDIFTSGGKLVATRDSVDLLMGSAAKLVELKGLVLITSLAQLQKLFREVYYPKVITFSMQLANLVDVLHKFTITYPLTVATLHQGSFIVAKSGEVVSTELKDTRYSPLSIWSGEAAVKIAAYYVWNPGKPLESAASGVLA